MFPEASDCAMFTKGKEDCSHLFFKSTFARAVWANQSTSNVDVTAEYNKDV